MQSISYSKNTKNYLVSLEKILFRVIILIIFSISTNKVLAQTNRCQTYYRDLNGFASKSTIQNLNRILDQIMQRVTDNNLNEDLRIAWNFLENKRHKLGEKNDYEFGAIQSLYSFKIEELERILDDRVFCTLLVDRINSDNFLKGVTLGGVKKTAYALLLSYYLYHSDPNDFLYYGYTWNQFKKIPYFKKFRYLNAEPVISKISTSYSDRVLNRIEFGYDYFEPLTGGAYLKLFEYFGVVKFNQDEITVYFPHLRIPLLYDLTLSEIEKLTYDNNFLNNISEQFLQELKTNRSKEFKKIGFEQFSDYNLTAASLADSLKNAAKLILSFKKIQELTPKIFFTQENFATLAAIEGLEVKKFPLVFRFDSRPLNEIIQTNGFIPNSQKKIGPIQMHSILSSAGSRYVSMTTKENNSDVLETISVGKFASTVEPNKLHEKLKNKLIKEAITNGLITDGKDTELKMLYEYKIEGITGVEASEPVSVAKEKEVVAPFVDLQKITAVRKVYILYGEKIVKTVFNQIQMSANPLNIAVSYGEWQLILQKN